MMGALRTGLLAALASAVLPAAPGLAQAPEKREECVVLLHGLARGRASMSALHWYLDAAGFRVVNIGYPSTRKSIESLSLEAIPRSLSECSGASRIHFVTHSMGGILLRRFLAEDRIEGLGRVVMLGPPNGGSEIVDNLGHIELFRKLNGPAGVELGTGEEDLPRRLGRVDFELGVIAGTRTLNLLTSAMIEGLDDGKVSVSSTKYAGATAHLTLPVTHTFMTIDPEVLSQTRHFIETGAFRNIDLKI